MCMESKCCCHLDPSDLFWAVIRLPKASRASEYCLSLSFKASSSFIGQKRVDREWLLLLSDPDLEDKMCQLRYRTVQLSHRAGGRLALDMTVMQTSHSTKQPKFSPHEEFEFPFLRFSKASVKTIIPFCAIQDCM